MTIKNNVLEHVVFERHEQRFCAFDDFCKAIHTQLEVILLTCGARLGGRYGPDEILLPQAPRYERFISLTARAWLLLAFLRDDLYLHLRAPEWRAVD